MQTSETSTREIIEDYLTLLQEDSHASKPQYQQLYIKNDLDFKVLIALCGKNRLECSVIAFRLGQLLKMLPVSRNGKIKFRAIWRELDTLCPNWILRLAVSAFLMKEGDVSLLPTPTARDWRSPGDPLHPRLTGSRGLPLTEDLGSQIHPELSEALMGFPIGWTELSPSATQLSRKSRTKSLKQYRR